MVKASDSLNESIQYDYSTLQWLGTQLELLQEHLIKNIDIIAQYPERDAETLTRLLSRRLEISEKNFLVTDGTTGAIHTIAKTFRGAKSGILVPTNSEFRRALEYGEHEVVEFDNVKNLNALDLKGVEILWISNPNTPDGRAWNRRSLLALLRDHPDTTFVIDSSMASFLIEESVKAADVKKYPNLIYVSSFSKTYNLPGLRIGYLVATTETLKKMKRFYTPGGISSVALEASRFVLVHPATFTVPIRKWLRYASELADAISYIDYVAESLPSEAPFFVVTLKEDVKADDLAKFLREKYQIKIATASEDGIEVNEYQFRVCALPTQRANEVLVDAMKDYQAYRDNDKKE